MYHILRTVGYSHEWNYGYTECCSILTSSPFSLSHEQPCRRFCYTAHWILSVLQDHIKDHSTKYIFRHKQSKTIHWPQHRWNKRSRLNTNLTGVCWKNTEAKAHNIFVVPTHSPALFSKPNKRDHSHRSGFRGWNFFKGNAHNKKMPVAMWNLF